MIRQATEHDAQSIAEIYSHYIIHSYATFETEPVTAEAMHSRVLKVQTAFDLPWLVLEAENKVVGYAYATQWKPRKAYGQTSEISVYLHHDLGGKGYGKALYLDLIERLKKKNYHAVIGGVSLPNEASVRLHESLGFEQVAYFKETGFKFDRWIDVGYWELIIS